MKYEIKNKKNIIMKLSDGIDVKNINVVCLGNDKIAPYVDSLEEIPISVIPFLLEEESIIFIEKIED